MFDRLLPFALLIAPAIAHAHSGGVDRTVAVEATGDRIHVLVHLEVSGAKRIEALTLMADADHDGRLSDAERAALERRLAGRALDGIRLSVDSSTITLEGVQTALKLAPKQPVALMVHGAAPLPVKAETIALSTRAGAEPLKLMVRPGTRPVVEASRGRPARGGLQAELKGADRVSWRIGPPP